MAMINYSSRDSLNDSSNYPELGPAYYDVGLSNIHYGNQFSKEERFKYENNMVPGPQYYEKDISFDLQESGIQQQTEHSSVFKSKIERFKKDQEDNIGPGSYLQVRDWIDDQEYRFSANRQNKIQKASARSRNQYQMQNKSSQLPDLQKNIKIIENMYKKNILDSSQQEIPREWKGINWSLQNDTKISTNNTSNAELGPGTYNPDVIRKNKLSRWSLESGNQRLFDQQQNNVGEQFKIQKLKQRYIDQQVNDILQQNIKEEYAKDANPGPGYYYQEAKMPQKKLNYKFGHKTERFKTKNEVLVGPGSYELDYTIKQKKPKLVFQTNKKRFEKDPYLDNPGPGEYDASLLASNNQQIQNFGSKAMRKDLKYQPTRHMEGNVGPGQYMNPDIIAFKQIESLLFQRNGGNFKSQTKREIHPQLRYSFKDVTFPAKDINDIQNKASRVLKAPVYKEKPQIIKEEPEYIDPKRFQDHILQKQINEQSVFQSKSQRFKTRRSNDIIQYADSQSLVKQTHNILYKRM